MMSIFDNMDSPFYKSALTFAVDEIDPADFSAFIAARFKAGNRKIAPQVIAKIIEFADGVMTNSAFQTAGQWRIGISSSRCRSKPLNWKRTR